MKTCVRCKFHRDLSGFSKDCSGKDGLRAYCKICARTYDRLYRQSARGSRVRRDYKKTPMGRLIKKAYRHRRRAYGRNAGKLTRRCISDVLARNRVAYGRLTCVYCKRDLENQSWHLEHLVPLSKEGKNTVSNLAVACPTCNVCKGSKLYEEVPRLDEDHLILDAWYDHLRLRYGASTLKSLD